MAERAGLNVATTAGEGAAHIMHWDEFNQTLGMIYQRDLNNQQQIRGEYSKLSAQMSEAAAKLRTADMPNFKKNYDLFRQAGIMLESSKVRNDPKSQAYWRDQLNRSYFDNVALAQQSENDQKFLTDMWGNVSKDPNKYKSYEELAKVNDLYNSLPHSELSKLGLNTAVPWMRPANAYPVAEFDKHVLGEPISKEQRVPVLDNKTGMVKGYWVNQIQEYKKTPAQIARDMAFGLAQVPDAAKQWSEKFNYDMQNQSDVVQKTLQDAQAILDQDPNNHGYKLGNGYADYAAASYITSSQPRDIGDKKYEPSPEWLEHEKDVDKQEQRSFAYGMANYEHKLRMQEAAQKSWIKFKMNNNLQFSGQELFDAANNPMHTYKVKDGNKEQNLFGWQVLDKRLSEIMSKVPKNYDYVVITRNSILNKDQRRRILDKLFGYSQETAPLYNLANTGGVDGNNKAIQMFLDYLNKSVPDILTGKSTKPVIDLNMNDINSGATPVIINRDKGTMDAIKLSTHNYDQFTSKLSQLLQQEKPAGSLTDDDDDTGGSILSQLMLYMNQNK